MTELLPGIYEELVTTRLDQALSKISPELVERAALEPGESAEVLSRHLAKMIRGVLASAGGEGRASLLRQVDIANRIAAHLVNMAPDGAATADQMVAASHDMLLAVAEMPPAPDAVRFPLRPATPLSGTALLVNGRDQPRIGTEVQKELASADHVDLLCAFIKWHGLRVIDDHIEALTRRGGRLRVITTTYMGATERRALDRLVQLGAEIKVSYETRMTRLHAKAWLFHRRSGFSTAYVGSSNLSKSALLDGLEWNVRLSAVEQGHLLDTFTAAFEEYWQDPAFETYDPSVASERARLDEALAVERGGPTELPIEVATLEVRPWGYQREILDELAAQRMIHDSFRNLVVMATGTGKTVVAGLDYRRLREMGQVDSLLFVAHREELLAQSVATFRHIMRDGSFGERFVSGERPTEWRHVFASVQSLSRLDLPAGLDRERFDMVIVDEFHHAAPETKTYSALLGHLRPKVLLGLTATPERADGQSVLGWFDDRVAVELRLWEALERGLLAPFQYFGLHDETDLRSVAWKRGSGYDPRQLSNIYTGHDARTRIVLQAVLDKVTDVSRMRALGFCVSIDHAEFMADRFNKANIPAAAITSRTGPEERRSALASLRDRRVNVLFTVDLFNEGIDVPEVDTVLFLRPTESATVFLQQLGRGLRLADDKPCLTVLDFIGNQARQFRFDLRYRALTGTSRRELAGEIERGFPTLPPGCHIQLDRVAGDLVLRNVRSSLRVDWKDLASELRRLGDVSLAEFLTETGLEAEDIYRRRRGGWAGLRRLAGVDRDRLAGDERFAGDKRFAGEQPSEGQSSDERLAGAIGRMLHTDDIERLNFIEQLLRLPSPPDPAHLSGRSMRLAAMLHFSLWGWNEPLSGLQVGLERLWANPARRQELLEVVAVLRDRLHRVTVPASPGGDLPLQVHASYSLAELLAAFGVDNPASSRGTGVRRIEPERAHVFWFNLRKTERHFSPTTMYADRAVSPTLFQWESQNATSAASKLGQAYVNHRAEGWTVHLFFRESKDRDGDLGAPAYLYAGPADYISHRGDRPMRIIWRLEHELPADVFHSARVATA